jgi:hypothetical protein
MSETITALTVAALVLALERLHSNPTWPNAAVLGAMTALATLARAELALLFGLVVLPAALVWGASAWRARVARLGAAAAAALVLLGPWVGYNLTRFHHPELVSTGFGTAVYAGTCDKAFRGDLMGYWGGLDCTVEQPQVPAPEPAVAERWRRDPEGTRAERREYFRLHLDRDRDAQGRLRDESDVDVDSREAAREYVDANTRRVPLVVAARLGRIWNLYRPLQGIELDETVDGRGQWPARIAFGAYWIYTPLAVAGAVLLRRRGHAIWPYVMLAVSVCITVAITYGIQRFRIPVDTVAPLLAAVAIDQWWPNLRRSP